MTERAAHAPLVVVVRADRLADPGLTRLVQHGLAGGNLTADEWRQALGDRPYRRTC